MADEIMPPLGLKSCNASECSEDKDHNSWPEIFFYNLSPFLSPSLSGITFPIFHIPGTLRVFSTGPLSFIFCNKTFAHAVPSPC